MSGETERMKGGRARTIQKPINENYFGNNNAGRGFIFLFPPPPNLFYDINKSFDYHYGRKRPPAPGLCDDRRKSLIKHTKNKIIDVM